MREGPILFTGTMVNAIMVGLKTQTRRLITDRRAATKDLLPTLNAIVHEEGNTFRMKGPFNGILKGGFVGRIRCPYGGKGDKLWIRETWRTFERAEDGLDGILFKADGSFIEIENTLAASELWGAAHGNRRGKRRKLWRPSIYMRRWMSRFVLDVTDVRAERLQEITEEDAIAEGFASKADFKLGWEKINGKRSPWKKNDWVWRIAFKQFPQQRSHLG